MIRVLKSLILLMICVFICFAAGCKKDGISKAVSNGKQQQKTEPSPKPTEPSSYDNENKPSGTAQTEKENFEIVKSEKIKGWKELKAKTFLLRLGEDSSSKVQPSVDDDQKDRMLKYTIDFPDNWTLNSTVFEDSNHKKVAEIPPAVLLKPEQESIFLNYEPAVDFGEELVSKETVKISSYSGAKIVTKISTESGSWYPHIYLITDGTYGYSIFLYSKQINSEDQELFDKIAATFSIEE